MNLRDLIEEIRRSLQLERELRRQRNAAATPIARIGRRNPQDGTNEAILSRDKPPMRGVRTFNSAVPRGEVVRSLPILDSLVALDWKNILPESTPVTNPEYPINNSLSIVFKKEKVESVPLACACPTYRREGNRCIEVCDGSGMTLTECLAIPPIPWPNPTNPNGDPNPYYVIWGSYRESFDSPTQGGMFYGFDSPICTINSTQVVYIGGRYWYFPKPSTGLLRWYGAGFVPVFDNGSPAPPSASVDSDAAIAWMESGQGWLVISLNNAYIADDDGIPISPFYFSAAIAIRKFIITEDYSDPPEPSFGSGYQILYNTAAAACRDVIMPGEPTEPESRPPQENKSVEIFLGGLIETPVSLLKLNAADSFNFGYVVLTDLKGVRKKDLLYILYGKEQNNEWCKCQITDISKSSSGYELRFTTLENPETIDKETYPGGWRQSMLSYALNPPETGIKYIDIYRDDKYKSVVSESNDGKKTFLIDFNLLQYIDREKTKLFKDEIKNKTLEKVVSICIRPFINKPDKVELKQGKNSAIAKVYALGDSDAQILGCYGHADRPNNAYKKSTKPCET